MKKMLKKYCFVFLSVIMILALFGITVFADEKKPAIKATVSGEVAFGNTVEVLISLENMPEFSTGEFRFEYNSDILECIEAKEPENYGDYFWAGGEYEDGKISCTVFTKVPVNGQIDVAVLSFKVKNGGDSTISVFTSYFDCSDVPERADFKISNKGTFDPSIANLMFDYKIVNSEAVITFCERETQGDIIIPEKIAGYPVTTIGENAFAGCSKLTSIEIPDSVKVIENDAFCGCDGITEFTIPGNVKTIGESAFWSCSNLENVVIKNGVEYVSGNMFGFCTSLKSIKLPDSITSIGYSAFSMCSKLKEISLSKSLVTIGKSAFERCGGLDNVVIPDGVTEIPEYAFYECTALKNIKLPKNLQSIGGSAFCNTSIKNIELPSGLKIIGSTAFYATPLEKIVIPYGVTAIKGSTFRNCENLAYVEIPETVELIESYAFYGSRKMTSINIPASVKKMSYMSVGYNNELVPIGLFTIYGTKGSEAERYANDHRIMFVDYNDSSALYDVNGDGKVTAADARMALRGAAQLSGLTGRYFFAADVNKDGRITASDARKILRRAAKLE